MLSITRHPVRHIRLITHRAYTLGTMDRTEHEECADSGQSVREGRAEVFSPSRVFYNPVQEFNRDLTIAVISEHVKDHFRLLREKQMTPDQEASPPDLDDPVTPGVHYEHGVKVLEALSASGLRSVRFALEIPGIKQIVTNDFDEEAVNFIQRNVTHNKVEHLVKPNFDDASMVMYRSRKFADRFDVIDLDPYGSASPFLDAAVQSLSDGGLLCITCTDMPVLTGNVPETCYSKYQAVSLRAKFCHEQALRILLQCVESHANRYSRYIVPLISISVDFYIRVYLKLYTGQGKAKHSVSKASMVYHCVNCGNFTLQPLADRTETSKQGNFKFSPAHAPVVSTSCNVCGGRQNLGGPFWNAPLHDMDFVKRVIHSVEKNETKFGTGDRIRGVLSMISEELPDTPLYYSVDALNLVLHCTPMKITNIRSAILNAGYEVSFSHCKRNSLKTTAPMEVIWDIFRYWVKKNPLSERRLKEVTGAQKILSKEPGIDVDFTDHPDANPPSRKMGLLRWQANPLRDWGPMARATKGMNLSLEKRRQKGAQKAMDKRRRLDADEKKRHDQDVCNDMATTTGNHGDLPKDGDQEDLPTDRKQKKQPRNAPNDHSGNVMEFE